MNLVDKTVPSQTGTLSFEIELRHPPEKVWRALTDPSLLAEWLLPVIGFKLTPGAKFTFEAPPQPGWDGVVHCRLIESEPHKRLSYSWVVGDMDTVVAFALHQTEAGTRLSIVHSGFTPSQKHNAAGARYGWNMMSGRLVELLSKIS
jgi:uncharacterized protein YndB with AHSA1/START domain